MKQIKTQDPKYNISVEIADTPDVNYALARVHLVNAKSGRAIPTDEPVFMLRAKDSHALDTLMFYWAQCVDPEHRRAVAQRVEEFQRFAEGNVVCEPDT